MSSFPSTSSNDAFIDAMTYSPYEATEATLTNADLSTLHPFEPWLLHEISPLFDLGELQRLSIELLLNILDFLPIPLLLNFRNVNLFARYTVDSYPKFRTIVQHAPEVLRGLLVVDSSSSVTLPELFRKLCQRNCDCCGALAQHFWLPTSLRLCFNCAHRRPIPLEHDEIIKHYNLTPGDLDLIPSFRFPSAIYISRNHRKFDIQGGRLYDSFVASQLIYSRCGRTIRPPGLLYERNEWRQVLRHPFQNDPIKTNVIPRMSRMNMATVVAPWISHGIAEMGVFCATCLYTEQHDQLYTRAEFVEHLKICRVQPFDDYLMFIRKALNREFRRLSFHHGDNWKDMGS